MAILFPSCVNFSSNHSLYVAYGMSRFFLTFPIDAILRFEEFLPEIILSEKYPVTDDNRVMPQNVDQRIVGGEEANIEDFPYQVSFIVNNSYFCGGFIVSENYILTAAHCAQK